MRTFSVYKPQNLSPTRSPLTVIQRTVERLRISLVHSLSIQGFHCEIGFNEKNIIKIIITKTTLLKGQTLYLIWRCAPGGFRIYKNSYYLSLNVYLLRQRLWLKYPFQYPTKPLPRQTSCNRGDKSIEQKMLNIDRIIQSEISLGEIDGLKNLKRKDFKISMITIATG